MDKPDRRARLIKDSEQRDVKDFISTALDITHEKLPSINVEALRLMLSIFRLSEAILYDLESSVQRPAGVSSPGFHLLWIIWLSGPIEASAAATMMGASRATVSGISATLESSGLIRRVPSPLDGRSRLLSLTDEGRDRFEQVFQATDARYVTWYQHLAPKEASTLVKILEKLMVGMKAEARQRV